MNWIINSKIFGCLAVLLISAPAWSGEVPCKDELSRDGAVPELKFTEIFHHPIGPRGMVFSEKVRNLEGKKVRITGYMVKQEQPSPGTFLLAPAPITLHEEEYGFCEDLPPVVIHVSFGGNSHNTQAQAQYLSSALRLIGTLHVGNRAEPDGRISTLRLQIDPPATLQSVALPSIDCPESAASKVAAGSGNSSLNSGSK